jgi:hypothetical protein
MGVQRRKQRDKRRQEQEVELPVGLVALRQARESLQGADRTFSPREYDKVQKKMEECSQGEETYPGSEANVVRCEKCPFREECDQLTDYLAGKVYVKRGM